MTLTTAEKRRVWLFVIVFVVLNAGSPLTHLGLPVSPAWRMYHSYRRDMCRAQFTDRGQALDRYAILGHDDPNAAPTNVRRVFDARGARRLQHNLCKKLGAPSVVEVELACGGEPGWVTEKVEPLKCRGRRR
jgi:hypothetical protein